MGRRIDFKVAAKQLGVDPQFLLKEVKAKRVPATRRPRAVLVSVKEAYEALYGEKMPKHHDRLNPPLKKLNKHRFNQDKVWQYPLKVNDMAVVSRNIREHGECPQHYDEFLKQLTRMAFDDPEESGRDYDYWPIAQQRRSAVARRVLIELERHHSTGHAPGPVRVLSHPKGNRAKAGGQARQGFEQ